MESKKDIRKQVLAKRLDMNSFELDEKSNCIAQRVISHPFFQNADAIYCYVDFRNEVKTHQIIQSAWDLNKKVAVPRIEKNKMEFHYITDFTDLVSGFYGVMEPQTESIAIDKNVLIIMPGSVYDKQGHRIGYGGGYYDKYLSFHPDYKTIAIAFDFQVLDKIPAEPHDIIPNVIITEEHTYDF